MLLKLSYDFITLLPFFYLDQQRALQLQKALKPLGGVGGSVTEAVATPSNKKIDWFFIQQRGSLLFSPAAKK